MPDLLDRLEARQVNLDLADHRHGDGDIDAVDAREDHAADLEQVLAHVKLRRIARAAAAPAGSGATVVGMHPRQRALDLGVALGKLAGAEVERAKGLLERKQVLIAPVAQQTRCDLFFAGLDAAVAVGGQYLRVALSNVRPRNSPLSARGALRIHRSHDRYAAGVRLPRCIAWQ